MSRGEEITRQAFADFEKWMEKFKAEVLEEYELVQLAEIYGYVGKAVEEEREACAVDLDVVAMDAASDGHMEAVSILIDEAAWIRARNQGKEGKQ